MCRYGSAHLLPLLVVSLCLASAASGEQTAAPIVISASPIANKAVREWSVSDVEYWMNHTVGYAELSGYVRKYLVDGPTLLQMEPVDFEEHFPVENAMQVVKLAAHVKLLKGLCLCEKAKDAVADFWSYFGENNFRVWVVGGTAVFFPRVAMAYTFLFDAELYQLLVGVPVPQESALRLAAQGTAAEVATRVVPFIHTLFYLISLVVAPELFMAFEALRLVTVNYVIMPLFVLHYLFQALNGYLSLYMMFKGDAFPPETPWWKKVWALYSYTLFLPFIVLVLYPVIPFFLQSLCVYAILVGNILVIFAGIASLVGMPQEKTA